MRIGIDAHMLGSRETGNETYIRNLVRALAAVDSENRYYVYLLDSVRACSLDLGSNFELCKMRPSNSFVRIPFAMPLSAWRNQLALLHVTYIAPPLSPCPTVVTIHDISYEFFPETFSARDRAILSTLVPVSARRSARVIADSEQTQRDLVHVYGLDPAKIRVIHAAAAPHFRPIDDRAAIQSVLNRYGIRGDYILAVGNLQPRKNLPHLIATYTLLRDRNEINHSLVIVGQSYWQGTLIRKIAKQSAWARDIILTGYVPDDDLVALYNGATLFVYPSLYEGFGLPPLEAMACGTPVICSNVSALPEVVGAAALQIDPTDVAALAEAIRGLLGNPALAADLAARGLARAAQFSWERTARETLAVYTEVAGSTEPTGFK